MKTSTIGLSVFAKEKTAQWRNSKNWYTGRNPKCETDVVVLQNKFNLKIHPQPTFCKRWDCKTCAPNRAAEILAHYLRLFQSHFPEPGIFYAEMEVDDGLDPRPRLRQQCSRLKAELLTVINSGTLFCFSNKNLGGHKAFFRRLNWAETVEKLSLAFRVPGIRPHGISASKNWRIRGLPGTHKRGRG